MSDLPTPDTSNYDGTFDDEPTYWQLADPLFNDQSVQRWVLPVPDGILQTRDELIDSLDIEAFASWVYTFTAPVGVIPWKRLPQQRREAFVKAIGAGMDAAYPKEAGDV